MKNLAAITVAAVSLAMGAVGFARAETGPDQPPASEPANPAAANGPQRHRPGLLGRTVHGELIVRNREGAFEKVMVDRGSVTAVGADSITLRRPDDVDVTVELDDQTRYVGVDGASAVQKDRPAMVVSKDGAATMVMQRDPDRPRPNRPGRRPAGPTTTTTVS